MRRPRTLMILSVTIALLFHGYAPTRSLATPREDLDQARSNFEFGEFRLALDTVDLLIENKALLGSDLLDAFLLRGQCELELGERERAVDSFCDALGIRPSWQPDLDLLTAAERSVMDEARGRCGQESIDAHSPASNTDPTAIRGPSSAPPREEATDPDDPAREGTSWYKRPIAWVGGAAVAVAAVLLASAGGGGDGKDGDPGNPPGDPPLDDFPDPPTR